MPYSQNSELPDAVKKRAPHQQDAFREAFNNALKEYGDEKQAYAVAWGAAEKAGTKKPAKKSTNTELFTPQDLELLEPVLVVPLGKAWSESAREASHSGRKKSDGDSDKHKKPYGDVEYADPGYKADGKARYPLTKNRLTAAWRYINDPANHKGYTSDQVSTIRGRISSAYNKAFGHHPGEKDE